MMWQGKLIFFRSFNVVQLELLEDIDLVDVDDRDLLTSTLQA
jgi:hypothetical protein